MMHATAAVLLHRQRAREARWDSPQSTEAQRKPPLATPEIVSSTEGNVKWGQTRSDPAVNVPGRERGPLAG